MKGTRLIPESLSGNIKQSAVRQTSFSGLDHRETAAGEALYDMNNLSPAYAPAIGVRAARRLYLPSRDTASTPHGLFGHRKLFLAHGEGLYSSGGAYVADAVGTLVDSDKCFAAHGNRVFILPDKTYYDIETSEYQSFDLETDLMEAVEIEGDCLRLDGISWLSMGFRSGDGITITVEGHWHQAYLSGQYRIRTIAYNLLYVDRNFAYEGTYQVRVSRKMPDMTSICTVGDRLFGCDAHTVYACEAGNPFNWCAKVGEESDPVTMSLGGVGEMTGCAAWQGYAVFFKEDHIYKLLGGGAGSYMLSDIEAPGVSGAARRSLISLWGDLYYLATTGVYRYAGSYPEYISAPLGILPVSGCGGSDGQYYYLNATCADGERRMYVFDPSVDGWYAEDGLEVVDMARMGDQLYFMDATGTIWIAGNHRHPITDGFSETDMNGALLSSVEFGEVDCGGDARRRLKRLCMVANAEAGSRMVVSVRYDRKGPFREIGRFEGAMSHRMLSVPVLPRYCESYRLRLEMTGQWLIESITSFFEEKDGT